VSPENSSSLIREEASSAIRENNAGGRMEVGAMALLSGALGVAGFQEVMLKPNAQSVTELALGIGGLLAVNRLRRPDESPKPGLKLREKAFVALASYGILATDALAVAEDIDNGTLTVPRAALAGIMPAVAYKLFSGIMKRSHR
jgi:citrate lyase beta subunit